MNHQHGLDGINSGGFHHARLQTIFPNTVGQVRELLRSAKPGDSYYPISTGYNWGLGSATPVDTGSTVIRLDRMREIRSVDLRDGYAVIEPGVTQNQLAQRLLNTPFMMNCTASSQHTSVLGNMVDRGFGVQRPRSEDLLGLEVVMADGSLSHVGWWPSLASTSAYKFPMGPNLVHAFTQSNLGVVTAAAIALLPRPDSAHCVRVVSTATDAEPLLNAMILARRSGLVSGVMKIYSSESTRSYGNRISNAVTAYMLLDGDPGLLQVKTDVLVRRLNDGAAGRKVDVLQLDAPTTDVAERALLRSYAGDPSANDHMVNSVFGVEAALVDTDASSRGWLFFLPVLPGNAEDFRRATSCIRRIAARHEIPIGYTANIVPAGQIDLVTSIAFDRNAQAARAHAALDSLHEEFRALGYPPYRTDIGHMPHAGRSGLHKPDAPSLLGRIKATLDPGNVLSPGRYEEIAEQS